jgi:hypothetical protein
MSLEVKDYTERKKIYKFEFGEFTLRPPYMYLVEKVQPLGIELSKLQKSKIKSEDGVTEFKKILDTFIKILKLILEETDNGKLENIKPDNLPINAATEIVNDFFYQFKI